MNYLLHGQESSRLRYRTLEAEDFNTWLAFFKDPRSNQYWASAPAEPEIQCKRWFDKVFYRYQHGKGGMNVLIDKQSGDFVGQCGLLIQTVDAIEEMEVGYSILPKFWNKGYATEAAGKCIRHAFVNNFRESLISIIHENNIESETVALKNGMTLDKRTVYSNNPVKLYRIVKGVVSKNSFL
jgi:RimJ/RimL family protein N-acetyltransferase